MTYNAKDLKEMANVVRADALRAIRNAHSGHVGIVLGAADIITTVFANFLRRGVDRFVLSAGHGSAMLYAALRLAGYDVGDLGMFRKIGGLPGHPEFGIDGVDATTGPLGQGVGNAVGYALAEKIRKSDGYTYCLCSDGDLMEGAAQESIAFAGRYKLNNLILLWDDNGISIDGTALGDIDVPTRMRAAGWNVMAVDGNDPYAINRALKDALRRTSKPTFIQCKTQIGYGSTVAGKNSAHGYGLSDAEIDELAGRLASPAGANRWAEIAGRARCVVAPAAPIDLSGVHVPEISREMSTREMSGLYVNELMASVSELVGGSADLGASTNVCVANAHPITPGDFNGNYIDYGVREHAMGAIMNGMAYAGIRPFGSTFLVFSDYVRPAMRIAALSGLPVIYVLTHDSVFVGEDGPTHQPIEQLPSLRLIPNMSVWRPCNMAEVAYSWRTAIENTSGPTCIILSRQRVPSVQTPHGAQISRGAYIVRSATARRVRATIIATGSEVALAIRVADKLGPDVQVVSMPSVNVFRAQEAGYKKQILRGTVIAIEAAATAPWFEFADAVVGIDRFGLSGDGATVYSALGFDVDAIAYDLKQKIK